MGVKFLSWSNFLYPKEKPKVNFEVLELIAIKECIERCYAEKLFRSYALENHAFSVLGKLKKVLKGKMRIEPPYTPGRRRG